MIPSWNRSSIKFSLRVQLRELHFFPAVYGQPRSPPPPKYCFQGPSNWITVPHYRNCWEALVTFETSSSMSPDEAFHTSTTLDSLFKSTCKLFIFIYFHSSCKKDGTPLMIYLMYCYTLTAESWTFFFFFLILSSLWYCKQWSQPALKVQFSSLSKMHSLSWLNHYKPLLAKDYCRLPTKQEALFKAKNLIPDIKMKLFNL